MGDEIEKEYFPILTQALSAGTILPFTCYVHLKLQDRFMVYVARDHEFSESKARKLTTFGHENVYIKNRDKERYFSYLNSFLETEEGKTTLKDLIKELGSLDEIPGLPDSEEFAIEALNDPVLELGGVEALSDEAQDKTSDENPEEKAGSSTEDNSVDAMASDSSSATAAEETTDGPTDNTAEGLESFFDGLAGENSGEKKTEIKASDLTDESEEDLKALSELEDDLIIDGKTAEQRAQEEMDAQQAKERAEREASAEGESSGFGATQLEVDRQTANSGAVKFGDRGKDIDSFFSSSARQLIEKIQGSGGSFTERERKIINECTEVIDDELIYIKDSTKKEDPGEIVAVIEKATLVLSDQVRLVVDVAKQKKGIEKDELDSFTKYVENVEGRLKSLREDNAQPASVAQAIAEIRGEARDEINHVKMVVSGHQQETVEENLKSLFGKVHKKVEQSQNREEVLRSIGVEDSDLQEAAPSEIASAELEQKCKELMEELEAKKRENETLTEELTETKERVAKQNVLLNTLSEDMESSKHALSDVYDCWEYYNSRTQLHADQGTKLKAKEIKLALDEMARTAEDSLQDLSQVKKLSNQLTEDIEITEVEKREAAQQITEEKILRGDSQQTAVSTSTSAGSPEEIEVLRCQLEDARALIEQGDKKIEELTELLESGSKYSQEMEKGAEESSQKVLDLEDKVDHLEDKNHKYEDAIRDSDRVIIRHQAEIDNRDEQITEMKEKLNLLENELEVFKSNKEKLPEKFEALPEPFKDVVVEKDKFIESLEKRFQLAADELRELKKKKANLEANLESENQQVKSISERLEKTKQEVLKARSSERSMETKLRVASGTLDASRKSVEKLTKVAETLRSDRTKYLNDTNEALANFKKAVNRATSLNKSLAAQKDKSAMLAKENDRLKEKAQTSVESMTKLTQAYKALESEKRQLAREVQTLKASESKKPNAKPRKSA